MKKIYNFKRIIFILLASIISNTAFSQLTYVTTAPPLVDNNGSSMVAFNVRAFSTIRIKELYCTFSSSASQTTTVWYKVDSINGSPSISTTNGWIIAGTATFTPTPSGTGTIALIPVTGLSIQIPSGSTYAIAISGASIRYAGTGSTPTSPSTFTTPSINLNMGASVGYGGTLASPIAFRQFCGKIGYEVVAQGPNNAGVVGITSPTVFCAGLQTVKAKIANKGNNLLDSVRINWELDGVAQPTHYFVGSLDTLNSTTFPNDTTLTLGTANFVSGVARTIKVWTSMPNGVADTVTSDDTTLNSYKAALNGTYTIGGASPNYATLAAAAADLNTNGICGPVIFNIRTGTYNGQIALGNISGASAINTITFKSEANNADSVNLTFTATAATDNYIIKLNDTKYTTFKNLKFTSSATSFSRIFDIITGCQFDTIQNCSLNSATATASSVNTAVIHTDGSTNTSFAFLNNVIIGGSWGLRIYGTGTAAKVVGMVAEGNQFINQYIYGIYSYYHQNTKIRNNTFTSNTAATYYAIFSYYADSATEIIGNKISGIATGYGIYTYYNYGSSAQPLIMANNTIQIGATGIARGIHSYYSQNNRIYNNTINVTSTSATTGYAGYFYYSATTYSNNEVKNNIFANTGGGYSIYSYNPTLSGSNNVWDYNNLYTSGSVLAQIGTPASTPADIYAWRAAAVQDKNSITYRPSFTSSTNLTPLASDSASWAINGRGIHANIYNIDINGNPRPIIPADGAPDLGAHEFTPTATPPMAVSNYSSPAAAQTAGQPQIFTFATDTVAKITWDPFALTPTNIAVRQYAGVLPAQVGPKANLTYWTYFYNDISTPTGSYYYNMDLYYRNSWLGNTPNTNLTIVKKENSIPWASIFGCTIDTIRRTATTTLQTTFGLYSISDLSSPLPVVLSSFDGVRIDRKVFLNWNTASEINNSGFEIERSIDGKTFNVIGFVKGKGNSNLLNKYQFIDAEINNISEVYYRLKQIDYNKKSEYSRTIRITNDKQNNLDAISVSPNPFNNELNIQMVAATDKNILVSIYNVNGQLVYQKNESVLVGKNSITINDVSNLVSGIYFLKVNQNGTTQTFKIVK